jgi:hypothetical protein
VNLFRLSARRRLTFGVLNATGVLYGTTVLLNGGNVAQIVIAVAQVAVGLVGVAAYQIARAKEG